MDFSNIAHLPIKTCLIQIRAKKCITLGDVKTADKKLNDEGVSIPGMHDVYIMAIENAYGSEKSSPVKHGPWWKPCLCHTAAALHPKTPM
jgi:hypothetical protein